MADGNASILEGALGVHGHVVQSSAVSLPLRLRVVCVPFPSVSNICERWKPVPACTRSFRVCSTAPTATDSPKTANKLWK